MENKNEKEMITTQASNKVQSEVKPIETTNNFYKVSMRQVGYDNYTALCDIIDNSLEEDVCATKGKVEFDRDNNKKQKIASIYIIDNGCGMSREVIESAMKYGSSGNKDSHCFGCYGLGLKTGATSIGETLEIFTKSENNPLYHIVYSFNEEKAVYDTNGHIAYSINEYGEDTNEYKYFCDKTESTHGTIVKISDLDHLSNKDYYSFKGTLKRRIEVTFSKYLMAVSSLELYIDGEKVEPIHILGNPDANILIGDGSFTIDESFFRYKVWYAPRVGRDGSDKVEVSTNGQKYLARSSNNQGFYIYRNNRLVGSGLTLGLWTRDPWTNGCYIELFIDGTADKYLNTSFTKTVTESSKSNTISQELHDKLDKMVGPLRAECVRREKEATKNSKEDNPELKEFYDGITKTINQDNTIGAELRRKGRNSKSEEENEDKEHETRGKQKYPNHTKKRKEELIKGFEEVDVDVSIMHFMTKENNERTICINRNHPFYEQFYADLPNDQKKKMAIYIACYELAKEDVGVYGDEDLMDFMDKYNRFHSSEVFRAF